MSEQAAGGAGPGGAGSGLCWASLFFCLSLACSYVGSLYVWKSHLPRDHSAVIKRRFTSVLIVSSLSPFFIWAWKEVTGLKPGTSLLALMGFRLEGIIPATVLPLLLTMVLFLGPLIQLSMDCPWDLVDGLKVAFVSGGYNSDFTQLGCPLRGWPFVPTTVPAEATQVIAPFTEELVFRACMLPMLVPCTGLGPAVFTCPLFFGVAHFHHVIEQLRFRQGSTASIFLSAVFQFSYTAVFGAYTAFIFIRTGHLIGPVLCHSFCNYVGFPAVGAALEHPQRCLVVFFYLLGVVLFLLLLHPMTDPAFFGRLPICSLSRQTLHASSLSSFSLCS
ncbi:CAAX prenyl protease 2 isoform X1 [Rhineura floridana]|uniref:CAAX prenyl protease 2 isoform X1 n=1 Tax=Rhineura floridana TaxID=261503 RepID=UPI002AC83F9E|nr:CAAX prenyl protease 2 isoform X1 [Rhineura floridana]